ncbi:Uncharacterised protein [Amycolatopsis camponoti]|uniref:Uncharacterized protein n=1 Tax=Amycolatopsis camponoti TaxID=2606593 RepID=A0A6I8LFA9_9PSEU|nr:Uncharacterised protein [Amycolatopsis camponoti]
MRHGAPPPVVVLRRIEAQGKRGDTSGCTAVRVDFLPRPDPSDGLSALRSRTPGT